MAFLFIIIATIIDGLFAGIAVQKVFVELPARRKIGAVAFAQYARASNMGNGLYIYPAFACGGFVLTCIVLFLANHAAYATGILFLIGLAAAFSVGVLVMTAFAAPLMHKISKIENKEELISPLLEKFVFYSYPRAVFIWLQFVTILAALILMR